MENEIQINTPSESVIAAYGIASWRRLLPQMIAIGGGLLGLILVFGFFWLFSGPIQLPAGTSFLAITSPRTLYASLSTETRGRLPEPWRLTLDRQSRWPVLFGASRQEDDAWSFFTISPRWSIPAHSGLIVDKTRAMGLLRAQESQISASSTTTYLSWWGKTIRHPSSLAQVEIHPSLLASSFLTGESVQMIVYRDRIKTNLPSSDLAAETAPLFGDVFLRFDPHATTTARTALLQFLNIDEKDSSLKLLTPTQLTLQYNSSGTMSRIQFKTQEQMSSSTKLSLLAALGFSKKVVQSLPDGSLLVERRLPNEEELQKESWYALPEGSLQLTDTLYQLQKGATSTQEAFKPCGKGVIVGRFSQQALRQLLEVLDLDFVPTPTNIQLYQDRTTISACLE